MSNDVARADCVENRDEIQEVYARLRALEQEVRPVSNPEELEALEHERSRPTDTLAALLPEKQLQANLDSERQKAQEEKLIGSWPGKLKNEGYEEVRIRTLSGCVIKLRVRL